MTIMDNEERTLLQSNQCTYESASVSTECNNELKSRYRFIPYPKRNTHWPLYASPIPGSIIVYLLSPRRMLVQGLATHKGWIKVRHGHREGWMKARVRNGREVLRPCKSYRRYEDWHGRNIFLFNGRIMLGADAKAFGFTNLALIIPGSIFVYYICFKFDAPTRHVIIAIGAFLWIITFVLAWMAALTDPGVIPRNHSRVLAIPPKNATVGLHGYKYCETCNIFRPPRSKHCGSCDNCVVGFDHHCPWLGNCVGARTYKLFVMFVTSVCLLTGYVTAVSIWLIVHQTIAYMHDMRESDDSRVIEAVLLALVDNPWAYVLAFLGLCLSWCLFWLCVYQYHSIALAQSTNERMRNVYGTERPSPSDTGSSCTNFGNFCTYSPPESLLPDMFEQLYCTDKAGDHIKPPELSLQDILELAQNSSENQVTSV